jgi:uncharacterized protein (DUF169 family)
MNAAEQLQASLQLRTAPVAIAFRDAPPTDLPRMTAAAPSGCTFWKRAASGQAFYTEASDHYNCPIGAHTHGVDLPPAQTKELQGVVETMIQLSYLRPEEVPGIPQRPGRFGVALYAPLATAPFEPEVVLVCGNAKQIMLLTEAAQSAGVGPESPLMGRPTCAAVPTVLQTRRSAASLGCIGNRVYTEMADDELYFALPGNQVGRVVEKLAAIVNANRELQKYHRARLETISV